MFTNLKNLIIKKNLQKLTTNSNLCFSSNYAYHSSNRKSKETKFSYFWDHLQKNKEDYVELNKTQESQLRNNFHLKVKDWAKRSNIEMTLEESQEAGQFYTQLKLKLNDSPVPEEYCHWLDQMSRISKHDAKTKLFRYLYQEMKGQKLLGLIYKKDVDIKKVIQKIKQCVAEKNLDEFHKAIQSASSLDFSTEQMNDIYDSLVGTLNITFAEEAGVLIFEKLKMSKKEFVTQSDCEYYKYSRFMLFFETIEGLLLSMRGLENKTSVSVKISKTLNHNYYIMDTEIEKSSQNNSKDMESDEFYDYNTRKSYRSDKFKLVPDGLFREDRDMKCLIKSDYVLIRCEADPNIQILGEIVSIENDYKVRLSSRTILDNNVVYKITKLCTSVPTEIYTKNLREFCVQHHSCCDKIRSIITRSVELKDTIREIAEEKIKTLPENFEPSNKNLTPNQKEAVISSLTQRLTLIQGPPGTGKTRTAAEIVREWIKSDPSTTILVTADSNIAVDNIFKECVKLGIKALRVGNNSNMKDFFDSHNSQTKAFAVMKKNPESVGVVCATCVGSAATILSKMRFERVLIDEAAQSTEVSNIATLVSHTKQLVIIGDHKQLPPTIQSKIAERYGYSISLFERLVKIGIKTHFLDVQYRMHPLIAEFPASEFYGGKLKTGITSKDRPLIKGFNWPNQNVPVCFVNIENSRESYYNKSYYNLTEINSLSKIYDNFIKAGEMNSDTIGIVTPYSVQKQKLTDAFGQVSTGRNYMSGGYNNKKQFQINTVDGFQGMEKELILFSAVRANDRSSVGFLADERRLNVMLTRARRGLIVTGNKNTLLTNPIWKKWIEWCEKYNLIINDNNVYNSSEKSNTRSKDRKRDREVIASKEQEIEEEEEF